MATGWAELWKRIRRLAGKDQRDHEGTWIRFKKLAARSERAAVLKSFVRIGEGLPERQRYSLAVAIARLLAPLEWPPEWVASRVKLVSALDALIEETDPERQASFLASHGPQGDDPSLELSHLLFFSARDLLRRPCRRDELPTVALLCNVGVTFLLRMLRRASKQSDGKRRPGTEVESARARIESAFMTYAEAAGELNEAVGTVLFEGLHASVEQES